MSAAAALPLGEAERRRLVRLCARLSGEPGAAEDLAQETLLEAWRNRHKLRDADGADRWLAAIARHVCLRRTRRRRLDLVPDPNAVAADDPAAELERSELAQLLDRALALLPPGTREALVHRYSHDASHAQIAARLGVSADAVSMRLSRGTAALRQALAGELREEAAAWGLAGDDGWRPTRVWCPSCGARTLLARRDAGAAELRCPDCCPEGIGSRLPLDNPHFARLVGEVTRPTAIEARAAKWSRQTFAGGAGSAVPCTRCARPVRVERHERAAGPGLHAGCRACGEQVCASLGGIALGVPAVRALRAGRRRLRTLAPRLEAAAVVLRFEPLDGGGAVDVRFARETLRLLG